ncbi:MAG: type II secretion system protein [Candidatus Staskawiczbacteria bacterium]|jgi:prepilin-type N-terminal cleavage/methylation domain-containing protein
MENKGFTLIELIVVIAIIAVLSGIILFSVTQYISKGKDSNISGNLAVLVPAGEVFYNGNGSSYNDNQGHNFCDPGVNSVISNAISQMPQRNFGDCWSQNNTNTTNPAGLCCYASSDGNSWAACAQEFTPQNPPMAYCVDSRGVKEEITNSDCTGYVSVNFKCPDQSD